MSTTRPSAYDDRIGTPIEASRKGAHRARPKPASAVLPVLAGIAVVLLVVGGVYTVLGHGSDDSSKNTNTGSGAVSTATASASATSKTTKASGTVAPPTPSSATTTSAVSIVDKDIKLTVLNSVSVQGLAKRVQASLEQDGWSVQRTDNSSTRNLVTTKIYYGKLSTKATASELAKDLGFGIVVKDSGVAGSGLVVVLGKDAE